MCSSGGKHYRNFLTNNSAALSWTEYSNLPVRDTESDGERWRIVIQQLLGLLRCQLRQAVPSYIINGLQTATYYVYSVEGLSNAFIEPIIFRQLQLQIRPMEKACFRHCYHLAQLPRRNQRL